MRYSYPRAAKCRICGDRYIRKNLQHVACSWVCGLEIKRQKDLKAKQKAERADTRKRKEKLKTRGCWLREAQQVFNRFIRLRDSDKPCVSCGTHHAPQWAAGHYRTVGACPELRFHEMNVHKQCNKNCNMEKSGNVVEYRIELEKRIGAEALAWIEGPHAAQHLSIEDIREIKAYYAAKCRELEQRKAA